MTGAYGFIGLNTIRMLLERGYEVDCIDIIESSAMDFEASKLLLSSNKNINYYNIDLMGINNLGTMPTDYDCIFHFAGILGVQNVLANPSKTLFANSMMAWNIFEFAKLQSKLKKLFYTSTSEVYAGTLDNFTMEIPTPEETPLALTKLDSPRTSYMLSKVWGEALLHYSKLPSFILRPHNIYGPRMGMRHVIPELLLKAHLNKDGDALKVYSASHTRAFCYIEDAINFISALIDAPDPSCPTVLNLGNASEEIPIRSLASTILDIVGKTCSIEELSETMGSPLRRCPDVNQIIRLSGYSPCVTIYDGVARTYLWYKENVF